MLVYAQHSARDALAARPSLDRDATQQMVARLFPNQMLEALGDTNLAHTYPPTDEIYAGHYAGVAIVAAKEFGIDYPSRISPSFITQGPWGQVYLHAMHSGVDWAAFTLWKDGALVRSLSLSPDSGLLEDLGERQAFEAPFWAGQHPVFAAGDEKEQTYPFVFHPLELAEAALAEFFGFQLEGPLDLPQRVNPEDIVLKRFKRIRKSKWMFWR